MSLLSLVLFLLQWTCSPSLALTNITVDDQDPRIQYFPTLSDWEKETDGADAGGTHMLASDPGTFAKITFTCVSIYFMSPLWPYRVTTALALDGQSPVILDLQDHSTPPPTGEVASKSSQVVHSFIGTESTAHTLIISVPPGDPVEVSDPLTSTPISTTTSLPSSSLTLASTTSQGETTSIDSSGASPTSSQIASDGNVNAVNAQRKLKIIGIGIGVGLGLLLLLLLWYFIARHTRRKNRNKASSPRLDLNSPDVWRSTAPKTSIHHSDGTDSFQYSALPIAEQADHLPMQLRAPHQGSELGQQNSNRGGGGVSADPGPKGQPPWDRPPAYPFNSDEERRDMSSWGSGHPQPLKFMSIG
ncbi:hypothetical protein GALMADRAFT_138688 [Galerina marginata CBS 339.88]|uniref:Mid2 domain-containing protein n=1 Tax=Galerina marginata (strain CBS 339.88) TaxID=685588 RepID=A0A067T393_GALM3|nr:hypothetical protein GALMADRAFT_138688 [Galerina marginata CBS 339.88]